MSVNNKPLLERSKKLFEKILSINVAVGTLQKIDQVVVAINFLDSVVGLPKEVYLDISVARHIL